LIQTTNNGFTGIENGNSSKNNSQTTFSKGVNDCTHGIPKK